jgi:hypothetical protein
MSLPKVKQGSPHVPGKSPESSDEAKGSERKKDRREGDDLSRRTRTVIRMRASSWGGLRSRRAKEKLSSRERTGGGLSCVLGVTRSESTNGPRTS